jgi:lipopolysaccharide/colanic/teichoic acid biosynthesis glycosyltransferase
MFPRHAGAIVELERVMAARCFDWVAASFLLVLIAPLLLLIAILIVLDDGGPVLFMQTRVGRHKRPFRICKFRSMREARVTRVGRRLRSTGLDELPQLVNVLLGAMSVIGPRPLTNADVLRLKWDGDKHALRWSVRPGIIGLAQLYAGRGARLSWFLDCRYVNARRLGMDVGIIVLSAAMTLAGKRRIRHWLRRRRVLRRLEAVGCPVNAYQLRGQRLRGALQHAE